MGLLFHPDFCLENVKVKNLSDLQKYEYKIASLHTTGWKQATIREKGDCTSDLILHYQDPVETLSSLFSNASNKDEFKMGPSDSNISFSTPDTGDWWKEMQVLFSFHF